MLLLDTSFLIELEDELVKRRQGPAIALLEGLERAFARVNYLQF